MDPSVTPTKQFPIFTEFERVTRGLRWAAIAIVLATFPHSQPQLSIIYALALAAIAYNLTRYSSRMLRHRFYASPITVLAVDSVFIGLLIGLMGVVSSPYSAFLIFLIITAAYKFGLRGVLIVASLQIAWLFMVTHHSPFQPLALSEYQSIAASAFALLALGILAERLTHSDREQRTELEKLSRENAAERLRLLALVNSAADAVFVVDAQNHIVQHNKAAASLVGREDLRGRAFSRTLILHKSIDRNGKPVDILEEKSGPQRRRDLVAFTNQGLTYDLDIQVTPVLLAEKKSADYIIVCRDITKEHTLDEQRKEFISVASHELRTPLAIMEAALSAALLNKAELPAQTITLIQEAHHNTMYLGGIVKDLAMLAEAQNDTLPIELTHVDPRPLLRQIVDDFAVQAKQQALSLTGAVAKDTPDVLSTEHHIKEILLNYVNNALKYTKTGSVKVEAKPNKKGGVLFSVKDTGIGITPRDQKRLFTKFFRAEDYRTRQTGGTGLGLYLCQELASRLNAKVWCESTLNQGSTFYLEVPPFSQLQRDRGEVVKAQVSTLVSEL